MPRCLGWCCLRCLTLRGINMIQLSVVSVVTEGEASTASSALASVVASTADPSSAPDAARPASVLVAVVPDAPLRRGRGPDGRSQRVQRHPALAVELRAAHLGAAEAARALHPDALDVGLAHRRLDGLAHRAAERHAVRNLLCHTLSHQLRHRLGVLHLEDVQLHLLTGQLLQVGTDAVGLGAAAADDDARPRGVDINTDSVASPLDLHVGDSGALESGCQQPTDRHVFLDVVLVLLIGIPPGLPVGGDTEPEAVGVDLLAHYCEPPFASSEASAVFFAGAFVAAALLAVLDVAALAAPEAVLAGGFFRGVPF